MRNIEVKARLRDPSAAEAVLRAAGARKLWTRRQHDTFFRVPEGWLKIRECEGRRPELIAYRRTKTSAAPRASHYEIAVIEDAVAWRRLLSLVLPPGGTLIKVRTLWLHGAMRIHIDEVDRLGFFLELERVTRPSEPEETVRLEVDRWLARLGVEPADWISVPYVELLGSEGARGG